jgi:glyoxylase I family protein
MRIDGLHHVGLTVSNLDKSLSFYEGVLGLQLLRRGHDLQGSFIRSLVGVPDARLSNAMLATPAGGMLELIEYHSPAGRPIHVQPNDTASTHFCLTVQDIDGLYRELSKKGVVFHSEPQRCPSGPMEGYMFVYSRDPDGAIVEFIQAPPSKDETSNEGGNGE